MNQLLFRENGNAFDFVGQATIGDLPTDIMCHKFQDRVVLFITQYGKIGNVYSVTNSQFDGGILETRSRVFEISPRFGGTSDETEGAIRYLMNFLQMDNLVVSLALKKINKDVLLELKSFLENVVNLKTK